MNLARFPRIPFAHLPTPLEHMPNLSRALAGPEIWIKRDDCTGMSTGGNKTRKLEFLLAEAREQDADSADSPRWASRMRRARLPGAVCIGFSCWPRLERRDRAARCRPVAEAHR